MMSSLRKSFAERFTETPIASGHLAHSRVAASSMKVVISETIPISSASGMNTAGEIGPISG